MTVRRCPITHDPISPDRHASPRAAAELRAALHHLPELIADLEYAITRQVRMSDDSGHHDDRLPYNPQASEAAWTFRQRLLTWTDHLARQRNTPTPDTWPNVRDTLTAWSNWMTTTPDGTQALDEILHAHHAALRAIDRPPQRSYAGPCPTCHGDIYGIPGSPLVRCTTCGTERDIAEARKAMLKKLAIMHLPASEAARAATVLTGTPTTAAQIRKWKHDNKIEPTEVNRAGQPIYDLREVVSILETPPTTRRVSA